MIPMFHGQNRSSIVIINPEDISLLDPLNYMWINCDDANIVKILDGGVYKVSSFYNIADTNESSLTETPTLLSAYYNGINATSDTWTTGINSLARVPASTSIFDEGGESFTNFTCLKIDFSTIGIYYKTIKVVNYEPYGGSSADRTYSYVYGINDTNVILLKINGSDVVVGEWIVAHGLSGNSIFLITYDYNNVYINNNKIIGDTGSSDVLKLYGAILYNSLNSSIEFIYDDWSDVNSLSAVFFEHIMYPKELTVDELTGIQNWFNAKYSIW